MNQIATKIGLSASLLAGALSCSRDQRGEAPLPASTINHSTTDPPPSKQTLGQGGKLMIRSNASVRWSDKCNHETFQTLKSGRRRLGISLYAFDPPTSGNSRFVVSLITADGQKRQIIDRFSPFPDAPFRETSGRSPQRFLITISKDVEPLEDSQIHIEVKFDDSEGKVEGGTAELSIDYVDLK